MFSPGCNNPFTSCAPGLNIPVPIPIIGLKPKFIPIPIIGLKPKPKPNGFVIVGLNGLKLGMVAVGAVAVGVVVVDVEVESLPVVVLVLLPEDELELELSAGDDESVEVVSLG